MSEKYLYSLAYAKSGDAVFLSHLDTMRVLERAVRRSGVEVCFTRGMNPHIRLSVYTALPVGVATDGDWFSLKLEEHLESDALKERINGQMPSGFAIVEAREGAPPVKDRVALHLAVHYKGSESAARAAAESLFERDCLMVSGERKGKSYTKDIRPFFKSFTLEPGFIRIRVDASDGQKPRLGELAKVLYRLSEGADFDVHLVRIMNPVS
jgi:radical SAM-linked protein